MSINHDLQICAIDHFKKINSISGAHEIFSFGISGNGKYSHFVVLTCIHILPDYLGGSRGLTYCFCLKSSAWFHFSDQSIVSGNGGIVVELVLAIVGHFARVTKLFGSFEDTNLVIVCVVANGLYPNGCESWIRHQEDHCECEA